MPTKEAPRDLFSSKVLDEKLLDPLLQTEQGPSCNVGKLSFLQPAKAGRAAALPCTWCESRGHPRHYSESQTPAGPGYTGFTYPNLEAQ